MKTPILVIALLLAPVLIARTWTATDGRTIEGELTGKTADSATIKRDDGPTVTVPLASLSAEDRAFVARAKVASTIQDAVAKFLSKTRRDGAVFTLNAVISGAQPASRLANSGAMIQELKTIEALAHDNARDKMLVIEIRKAVAALEKASADKSQVAEGVRALASLKAQALK